jgi:hypothetical protein
MRKELYEAISARLMATGAIRYVDLWNRNVEFIEQEENWERPAVFVEFDPIVWSRTKERYLRTVSTIKLHIVTDWVGSASTVSDNRDDALSVFDLPEIVRKAIEGMAERDCYYSVALIESHTNHNHEDILENIEVYQYKGIIAI